MIENNLVRQSQTQTHLHQAAGGSEQLYPHWRTHDTVDKAFSERSYQQWLTTTTDSLTHTHTHTHTHHGVEGLLQLQLLLQEQSAGHTLPLAVAASRGEETRQQHYQVPHRDLHRSAQPGRQAGTTWSPAGRREESETRVNSWRNWEKVKPSGIRVQPAGREQTEWHEHCVILNFQGSLAGFGRSVKASVVGECSANSRRCGWDGERAQPEAISEKMGIFQWSRMLRPQAGNHNRLKLQLEVCVSGSDPGQDGSGRVRTGQRAQSNKAAAVYVVERQL